MSGQKTNPSPLDFLPVYKIPFPPGAELSSVPGIKMRENLVPPSGPVISLNLWELWGIQGEDSFFTVNKPGVLVNLGN